MDGECLHLGNVGSTLAKLNLHENRNKPANISLLSESSCRPDESGVSSRLGADLLDVPHPRLNRSVHLGKPGAQAG